MLKVEANYVVGVGREVRSFCWKIPEILKEVKLNDKISFFSLKPPIDSIKTFRYFLKGGFHMFSCKSFLLILQKPIVVYNLISFVLSNKYNGSI